jgi:hypothetical protein
MKTVAEKLASAGGTIYRKVVEKIVDGELVADVETRIYFNRLGRLLAGGYDDRFRRETAYNQRHGYHTNPTLFFHVEKNKWYSKKITKEEKALCISKILEKIVPESAVLVCSEKEEV